MSDAEKLFRDEVIENKRERLWGEVVLAQPLSAKVLTPLLLVIVIALLAYLFTGTYTRKETVIGYLVPSQGLIQISSPSSGTLAEVFVKPGDVVSEGDLLFRINTSKSMDDGNLLSSRLSELLHLQKAQVQDSILRLTSNNETRHKHLKTNQQNIIRQLEQLNRQSRLQQERLQLAQERYDSLSSLQARRLISDLELQNQYQTLLDEKQRLEQVQQSLLAEQSRLDETLFQIDLLSSELEESRDQLMAEIRRIDQQLLQLKSEESFTLRAPTPGRISSLQANTGQMIDTQRPLVAILPLDDELKADLFISTRSIGFVKVGQSVRMRYEAFPYERFGLHEGEIEEVAKTILAPQDVEVPFQLNQPVYRVTATLNAQEIQAFGDLFPLQAGMTLEADILLDTRPLYQWLLKPLFSLKGTL